MIQVTFKDGEVMDFNAVTMSEFIIHVPEWRLNLDSIAKVEALVI